MAQAAVGSLPASLRGMLEELVSAEAAASQRWILALLKRHGPGVVALLWRMLGCEADVLDAYQTVVCQLAARGPRQVGRNRGAYFYRSAINAGIEVIRRRQRDRGRLHALAERQAQQPAPSAPGVYLEHVHLVDQIRTAVLALPDHLRDVIVLHDLVGLDYLRVSNILSITVGTARVYRRQAVIRLSEMLAKEESR